MKSANKWLNVCMYLQLGLQGRALLSYTPWVRDIVEKGQRAEKDTHQNE